MIERRSSVLSAGLGINSWTWPSSGADTVLLMHGGRDQSRSWDFLAQRFGQVTCVAADLRGHGDSEWSPEGNYGLADMTADMGEVLLSLPGKVSIIAHSLGGNIALRLAAIFPERVRAVAAIECLELPEVRDESGTPVAERYRHWFDTRKQFAGKSPPIYPDQAAAAQRMAARFPGFPASVTDHLAKHSIRAVAGGYTWKFDHRTRSRPPLDSDSADFDAMLSSVLCPVLLFYGDQSFVPLPQPERVALLKRARLIRYPDAGHWLHHQELDRFTADTTAFLNNGA